MFVFKYLSRFKVIKFVLPISVTLICFNSPQIFAQTSAGQLLQEIQKLSPPTMDLPEASRETSPLQPKLLTPKPGQLTFEAKEFKFVGNTKVTTAQLQNIVSPFVGKKITFDDLQQVTDLITQFYREQGWLVRAILPEQDITGGVITVRLIEAKLGNIQIDNQSKRVSTERIENWIYARMPKDGDLSLKDLDQTLLTLNDMPDVEVASTLKEGAKPGETILLVTVVDKPLLSGQAAVDNYGDRNTGRIRGSVQANVNGPLGMGDQVALYGLYSEGSAYGRLGYTAPVGSSGLRIGANGSYMQYRVLNQSFQSLYANGVSSTAGLEATYPIIRSRPTNLMAVAYWNWNNFKNWTINGLNSDQSYNTSVGQLGLTGNALDDLLGGGLNVGSIIGSAGEVNRNALGQYNGHYGVAGAFTKLRYTYNRQQAISDTLSAYLAISGQWASKNMDSSEQLYLGGPLGVRAYGSGQGASSQGNLTSFELRQNLPYQTQLVAFYDLGNAQTWKFNNPTVNAVQNNYALQGYGLSFVWFGPYGTNVKATWAQRVGPLPQSVSTYLTQNGGLSPNRFWLTASVPF